MLDDAAIGVDEVLAVRADLQHRGERTSYWNLDAMLNFHGFAIKDRNLKGFLLNLRDAQ